MESILLVDLFLYLPVSIGQHVDRLIASRSMLVRKRSSSGTSSRKAHRG